MAVDYSGKLPILGTINIAEQAIGPGYSNPYPDQNNIPISQRAATGHEVPWNHIRNDGLNPVHDSFVHSGVWQPTAQKTKDYCIANQCSLSYQNFYPSYDGWQ